MKKINSKKSFQNQDIVFMFPYFVWLILFLLAPIVLLIYQSLLSIDGAFTFENILRYITSITDLAMTFQSFLYAGFITIVTLIISSPAAYILTKTALIEMMRMFLILPT